MKTKITLLLLSLLAFGCSSDDTFDSYVAPTQTQNTARPTPNHPKYNVPTPQNKVLLLKVDYLTQAFEGGRELIFPNQPGFTLTYNYQPAGDFGGMSILYAEVGQPIFSGTIIWMGLGAMQYPANLWPASTFATTTDPVPGINDFSIIDAQQNANYYPDPVPLPQIWDAIGNLQLVHQYRASNPTTSMCVFLYTPSVGVGNPEDWDYFVMLKN